jgi:hypothetical protein
MRCTQRGYQVEFCERPTSTNGKPERPIGSIEPTLRRVQIKNMLKKEVDKLNSDLEKKKQLLDIVPEIVNVASKI